MLLRLRDERGIALITALLVTTVVVSLGLVVVALSLHNSAQSSLDRKRVQAIAAAEAGIDATLSQLVKGVQLSGNKTLPCTVSNTLTTSPPAEYEVAIDYYSTWPPTGSPVTCPSGGLPAGPNDPRPAGAVVTSRGTAVTSASTVAKSRTMQTAVRLTPIFGGLNQAVFSDVVLNFQNRFTINGNVSNDGDVYTNGDLTLSNYTSISGSAYSQGAADIGQGIIQQDVWARNAVSLASGSSVFGDVTSSTSSVDLANAHVYQDVRAGASITVDTASQVDGDQTPNSPQGPPPQFPFPQLKWNEAGWTNPSPPASPYTVTHFTDCASAKSFVASGSPGNRVARIDATCNLLWRSPADRFVNVRGNLAIITNGSLSTQNRVTFRGIGGNADGTPWTVFLIRPYPDVGSLNCAGGLYDISVANFTEFENLRIFVYSPCTVNFGNNNAAGVDGQIIGGTVNITNQMVLNFRPIIVPDFNVTGYNSDISFLREIVNE
jgi:cytoskeletal protein CcmA (bactofilin family)